MLASILADGTTSNEASTGGGIASLLIFLLIPVAMYFLLIRPQRRRQKEQAAMQSAIDVGDEIMTTSGVYGFITGFDGDVVWLEIDDNVQIRIARAAVQRKVDTSASGSSDGAADAKPSKGDDASDDSTRSTDLDKS
jgi:preprotein translocase subunit YajC